MKYFFWIHACLLQPLCCFALESNLSNEDIPSPSTSFTVSKPIEFGDYLSFKTLMKSDTPPQSSESPDLEHLSPYLNLSASDLEANKDESFTFSEDPPSPEQPHQAPQEDLKDIVSIINSDEESEENDSQESELSNSLDESDSQGYNDDERINYYTTEEDIELINKEYGTGLLPMRRLETLSYTASTSSVDVNDLILDDMYMELSLFAEYVSQKLEKEDEYIGVQIEQKFLSLLDTPSSPLVDRLKKLDIFTEQVCQLPDGNVHVFDSQAASISENLNAIGDWLEVAGNPDLSLAQIGQEIINSIDKGIVFLKDYSFQDANKKVHQLSSDQIKNYASSHFLTMDNEIGSCPLSRAIWSRSWTLVNHLWKNELQDDTAARFFFDTVVENYVTGGGCIQGRINRGLILYARLLRTLGIGVMSN